MLHILFFPFFSIYFRIFSEDINKMYMVCNLKVSLSFSAMKTTRVLLSESCHGYFSIARFGFDFADQLSDNKN